MNENDDEIRDEAARVIQRKWRETKVVELQQGVGVEDTEAQENDRRNKLLQEYKDLSSHRDKMLQENAQLQRKLSHYYLEKKGQEPNADKQSSGEQTLMDLENRYLQFLQKLKEERLDVENTKRVNEESIEDFKHKMQTHLYKAMEFEAKFREYKRQQCAKAEFTRTGKVLPTKKLHAVETDEETKSEEVKQARINYIKLRNKMKKLAHLLKEKEKLTDGLHLIDFEQLKIENTTLNEKIEERNEDLMKLKKKATTTIHILTHVKEKLQFIQGENQGLKKQLAKLEEELAEHRDRLTQVKRDRDMLVNDNVKMREKMPMVGAEDLLVDYENRKKEIERLRTEVVALKNKHHGLFVWIAQNTPHTGKAAEPAY
eukprot:TRINITY_DN67010_c0_g1_i1.p1 TRINITY_DN67010_c0_g1~~TRINITY_DN67010_c0_g1_i1.p1  ORF type:complete len:372 (-),score=65.86 TRINITY_DN67010_c0_g1_i1:139-1254(-)